MPNAPSPSPSPRFQIFAPTAPGLESIAAGELNALGVRGTQEVGGVGFGGELGRIYEANLWLRTASRVVVRLGQFYASTFYELERHSKKLPWADFLPESGSVEVRVTCRKSKLYHSDAVAERVLSAIAGAASRSIELRSAIAVGDEDGEDGEVGPGSGASGGHTGGPTQLFIVRIVHDQVEISADSSGELLHRRGYRKEVGKAPLRETLAAAMVLASGWQGQRGAPLLDPMCGSGTIPIEAALIARGIAPGLQRDFQFMKWPSFDRDLWDGLIEKARSSQTKPELDIHGTDRDTGAISAAMHNAARAGIAGDAGFSVESLSGSIGATEDVEIGEGWILTNPPYGVRVGETKDLRDLYSALGTALKAKHGWRIGLLTSDAVLAAQMRLPLSSRFATRNGGIPVSFLVSEKSEKAVVRSLKSRTGGVLVNSDKTGERLNNHLIGTVASINLSAGGVPKRRVTDAKVSRSGLEKDAHNDINHGGLERAVCLYSLERIRSLQAEGHPIGPGTAGENVTVEGIDWELIVPGVRLRVGDGVLLEVASFTNPCKTIKASFIDGEFIRIAQKLHPGWSRVYARVLSEGSIRSGDPVEVDLTAQ